MTETEALIEDMRKLSVDIDDDVDFIRDYADTYGIRQAARRIQNNVAALITAYSQLVERTDEDD